MNIDTFLRIAISITGRRLRLGVPEHDREFRSLFGVSASTCLLLWNKLRQHNARPPNATPKHLMWALLFLKSYGTEFCNSSRAKTTRKTFRKWVKIMLGAMTNLAPIVVSSVVFSITCAFLLFCVLPVSLLCLRLLLQVGFLALLTTLFLFLQIRWENRFINDIGRTCKITVDGTDFRIYEQHPFNKKWYSHKFHGPGVRYEVGLCIQTGHIVWIRGPFPCGRWPDIKIFKRELMQMLLPGEKAEADKGYRGYPHHIRTPGMAVSHADLRAKKNARGRHDTVNKRFKQWGALKQVYRHDIDEHYLIFKYVAVITKLCLENGEPLYNV